MALPGAVPAAAQSVVVPADLQRALEARRSEEDVSRARLRQLLTREDVRALAGDAGLDLRQAQAAVATLDGEELRDLAARAARAEEALAGGQTIQISLIAALLIVIIIILLVD
jgi:hypothetical protein